MSGTSFFENHLLLFYAPRAIQSFGQFFYEFVNLLDCGVPAGDFANQLPLRELSLQPSSCELFSFGWVLVGTGLLPIDPLVVLAYLVDEA